MDTNNMKQDKFYVYRVLPDMIDVKCGKCGGIVATLHDSDVELVGEKTYLTKKEISCRACNETIPAGMLIAQEEIKKDNEEVEKAERTVINSGDEKNTVAKVLQIYAIINAICGLILAFRVGADYAGGIGFLLFCSVLVASGFIYAFGEVIKLLHEIKLNTRKTANGK